MDLRFLVSTMHSWVDNSVVSTPTCQTCHGKYVYLVHTIAICRRSTTPIGQKKKKNCRGKARQLTCQTIQFPFQSRQFSSMACLSARRLSKNSCVSFLHDIRSSARHLPINMVHFTLSKNAISLYPVERTFMCPWCELNLNVHTVRKIGTISTPFLTFLNKFCDFSPCSWVVQFLWFWLFFGARGDAQVMGRCLQIYVSVLPCADRASGGIGVKRPRTKSVPKEQNGESDSPIGCWHSLTLITSWIIDTTITEYKQYYTTELCDLFEYFLSSCQGDEWASLVLNRPTRSLSYRAQGYNGLGCKFEAHSNSRKQRYALLLKLNSSVSNKGNFLYAATKCFESLICHYKVIFFCVHH